MAESEEFTTETGCRVRVVERDQDFLLELRIVDEDPELINGRFASVQLQPWELHRLHSMTFRTQRVQDIPTETLLAELGRRTNKESR